MMSATTTAPTRMAMTNVSSGVTSLAPRCSVAVAAGRLSSPPGETPGCTSHLNVANARLLRPPRGSRALKPVPPVGPRTSHSSCADHTDGMQTVCRARRLHRHASMGEPEHASTSHALRAQEVEFYEWVMALLASMPPRTPVAKALATPEGQRIRTKWMLKYGRQPPL